MPGQPEILAETDLFQRNAGGNRHCEGIHGQGHGYGRDVEKLHGLHL
jgi:hypothetical protein